ncbi:MAG: nucleotidyltransferase family protein [Zetaproteobacteria bacterium]|nr:MAG: nucleotidyltransferase family protein [Zetaproteobacteria bacterium]
MRAVVLAAGLGTRLRWLTRARPKALMPCGERPVIEQVILRLVAAGVRWIAVNAHHHAEQLAQALGDGARFGCAIRISYEPELLDSGAGAVRALKLLPEDEGPVIVHNADVLTDLDLRALWRRVPPEGAAIGLVRTRPPHLGDFAVERGALVRARPAPWTFAGVSAWDARALAAFGDAKPWSLTEGILAKLAEGKVRYLLHEGAWADIGRPRSWFLARWRRV